MRRTAAIVAARAAAGLSRRLRIGGGTALPGLIAERIDPGIVPELAAKLGRGSVLVTGTNGKTTTARLLRSVVQSAGLRAIANREGSNMMRGVAAALAEASTWSGNIRRRKKSIGVFEVDEATMPLVARAVSPKAVVFTNLFRDQLDRYGEVETVAAIWRKAIAEFPPDVTLIINADDPAVASLREHARGPVDHLRPRRHVAGHRERSNTPPTPAGARSAARSWSTRRSSTGTSATGAARQATTSARSPTSPAPAPRRLPSGSPSRSTPSAA